MMPEPNSISLQGCRPEPLANYLKALGILRLVVEQKQDRKTKGYWQDDTFNLTTSLSPADLEKFLLYHYEPTPLVAPWNGSTGFYPKDNQKTIETVRSATAQRLQAYRQTVEEAQKAVNVLNLTVQPKDKNDKRRLLERLRNTLPDEAVKWLDTCALVTSEEISFPPLAGTGGNDGNFEFSRTFMQQLQMLFDFQTGNPLPNAIPLLKAALFDETLPGLAFSGKIGQFNPMAAGGVNAAPGYDADSRVNPWDYILMLEGMMLFTAGATRRYEQAEPGGFAYPFTVRTTLAGYGSAAEGDEARAELWIPLWKAPTGLKELQALFGEGRAKVNNRPVRDGVDFARAMSNFGVSRGIQAFVRYSFQMRNGLSYFAVPLGRFQPQVNPKVDRLTKIDDWLLSFNRTAQDERSPASLRRAQRRLETVILDLTQKRATLLDVLITLGEAEAVVDRSLRSKAEKFPRPLPRLGRDWVEECNDGSLEFKLALALASRGLRQRLVWVRQAQNEPFPHWAEADDRVTTWQQGTLVRNLLTLLKREEIEIQQQKKQGKPEAAEPNPSPFYPVSLDAVMAWIDGRVEDQRIEAIARGLSLVKLTNLTQPDEPKKFISPSYALLKLMHQRVLNKKAFNKICGESALARVKQESDKPDVTLPRVPELLAKLALGDGKTAINLAIRRLYASGLNPVRQVIQEPSDRLLRIAAALAFPISVHDTARLYELIRRIDTSRSN